ncbi:MAG: cyclase family protein, partial [Rhodospirillaceae bacterium]|nr:cyclase family protein [Rhodospirillaceae bacterium]
MKTTISTQTGAIMRFIDLSHTFGPDMPAYPGDPIPKLQQIASIPEHGYTAFQLDSGMHVGTHMDAPQHMIPG